MAGTTGEQAGSPFSEATGHTCTCVLVQVLQRFIVDFYCHKAALVVEVDGDIHDLQQEEDARREKVLSALGLRIVRFGNDEVVRELFTVVRKIREIVSMQIL